MSVEDPQDHEALTHAAKRYDAVLRAVLLNPRLNPVALAHNRRQWLTHHWLWN